jgi:hypothetical protein
MYPYLAPHHTTTEGEILQRFAYQCMVSCPSAYVKTRRWYMDTIHVSETRSRPRFLSRPFVPSQHHVGVLARALPPVLKDCGVIQRPPGVAEP